MRLNRGDIALLVLLFLDGVIIGILSVAFLSLHIAAVPAPIGIAIAAIGNALLLWLASGIARPPLNWIPVFGWGLVVLICLSGGPGGDVMFPSDWRLAALILAGGAAPAISSSLLGTRRRINEAVRQRETRGAPLRR